MKKNKENIEADDVENKNKNVDVSPTVKVKTDKIVIRKDLYPREEIDQDLVKTYSENIEMLPPPVINQDNILIDGGHRLEAFKLLEYKEIECKIIETKDDDEILRKAVEYNSTHGKQLSYSEKKAIAIKLFNSKNGKQLVKVLSVSPDCFNKWVRDIRKKQSEALENDVVNEYLDAKTTQEEVAKKFDVSIRKVSEIKSKFSEKINLLLRKKEDVSAEDQKKHFDIYNFKPYPSNCWGVYSNDNSLDESEVKKDECRANQSLLYHFTEPFDIVYMPEENRPLLESSKLLFRRSYTGNITVPPNLVFLEGNDDNLERTVKQLKQKMKRGFIAIKTDSVEQDDSIHKMMDEIGFTLDNRIIMPYTRLDETYSMQHGYDSLLVFKAK